MTPDLLATETELLVSLVKLAHKQGWLDRLLTSLRKKHPILVLGSSVAGKTAFLQSLTATVPNAIDRMVRTEFAQKHPLRIAKEPFVFTDTPGQTLHRSRRIQAIREAMKNPFAGIINVVSYGYHEHRVGKREAVANGAVNEEFLAASREVEIRALSEWTEILGDTAVAGWLITVVTKADLWWNRRDAVMAHYSAGPYAQSLGDAARLRPVVLEYCSVFQKFYNEVPMSGELQDADRVLLRGHLIRQLLASIGRPHK